MEQEILKKLDNIEGLVQDFMAVSAKSFTALTKDLGDFKDDTKINFKKVDDKFKLVDEKFEKLESKIDGVQRAVDSVYERQSSVEARVSKLEAEM